MKKKHNAFMKRCMAKDGAQAVNRQAGKQVKEIRDKYEIRF